MLRSWGGRFSSQENINHEKKVAKAMRVGGTIAVWASGLLGLASSVMACKTGSKAWVNATAASAATTVISVGVMSYGTGMEDILDSLYVIDYDID